MNQADAQKMRSEAPEREESVNGISLHFDGSERRRASLRECQVEERIERREGKLSAILFRLRMLWAWQTNPATVSRLDGQSFITEAEWAALAESALFAKLRAESAEGGEGGACANACALSPLDLGSAQASPTSSEESRRATDPAMGARVEGDVRPERLP